MRTKTQANPQVVHTSKSSHSKAFRFVNKIHSHCLYSQTQKATLYPTTPTGGLVLYLICPNPDLCMPGRYSSCQSPPQGTLSHSPQTILYKYTCKDTNHLHCLNGYNLYILHARDNQTMPTSPTYFQPQSTKLPKALLILGQCQHMKWYSKLQVQSDLQNSHAMA